MTRTTRKEPINEEQAEALILSGWRVTQPETTRHLKAETSSEPEAEPDDTQDDDASQANVGNDND